MEGKCCVIDSIICFVNRGSHVLGSFTHIPVFTFEEKILWQVYSHNASIQITILPENYAR